MPLDAKVRALAAHKGMVFSTSGFQKGAIEFAEAHGIALFHVKKGSTSRLAKSEGVELPGELEFASWRVLPESRESLLDPVNPRLLEEIFRHSLRDTLTRFDGFEIAGARSRGSRVFAAFDWRAMVLFPGDDIERKACSKGDRINAFDSADHEELSHVLGHYSDVQSINSEDTVTWSCFRARSIDHWIDAFVEEAFGPAGRPLWNKPILWERRRHPDQSGDEMGPEADVILESGPGSPAWRYVVEAKWMADLDGRQGVDRTKTQLDMRLSTARAGGLSETHCGVIVICPRPSRYLRRPQAIFRKYFQPSGDRYISLVPGARVVTWERIATMAGGELEKYLTWRLGYLDEVHGNPTERRPLDRT
jgi:hypothetical protein